MLGFAPKGLALGLISIAAAHAWRERFRPLVPVVVRISRALKQPPERFVSRTSIRSARPAATSSVITRSSGATIERWQATGPIIGYVCLTTFAFTQAGSLSSRPRSRRTVNSP